MNDITQEQYEKLQKQYDGLRVQFKRQKQRIRKLNRTKYNRQREQAANSDAVKEIRNKANSRINKLNSDITRQEQEIEYLQEECTDWKQAKQYTYQRYIASLSFAICSTIGWYFTLRGIENCICE
jgi:predicted RNase H-like nuclease (RuvC/YqgF family)